MMTGKIIGPSSVTENSNGPLRYSHADMLGLRVAWRNRLIVSSAWCNSFTPMYLGKEGSMPTIMASKRALNVRMDLSVALRQLPLGGMC